MAPPDRPSWFTSRDAAEKYSISLRRIQDLAAERGIGIKVAGRLVFTREDLKALRPRPSGRPPRGAT